jgi:hypothetical protein
MKRQAWLSLLAVALWAANFHAADDNEESIPIAGPIKKKAVAEKNKTAESTKSTEELHKFGPQEVEVKLRDGSLLRGEIANLDSLLPMNTPYGALNIPFARIARIQTTNRLSGRETEDLSASLKDLDSNDFNVRNQAQARLQQFGARALATLSAAREKASPEARSRLEEIIKKITPKNSAYEADDSVLTDEFEAHGFIQAGSLTLKMWMGEIKINLDDLERLIFLAKGRIIHLTLFADSALNDWQDTLIDLPTDEPLRITCTGGFQLFGNTFTPEGSSNYDYQQSGNTFLPGATIGRLGLNGKPFLVGAAKDLKSRSRGRLYLKIFWNDQRHRGNDPASGTYAVRIATGIWVGTTPPAEEAAENPEP